VKCTVPAYAETMLFEASSAFTVRLKDVPEVAMEGTLKEN
jgi:hypothetical protein